MSLPLWNKKQTSKSKSSRRARRRSRDLRSIRPLERFEDRTLMAVAYGVTGANALIRFDTATPSAFSSTPITGVVGGDPIIGLDFRPATGQLYALGAGSRLYTIDQTTAVATQVGVDGGFALNGSSFGFDFNPQPDRIRVVSNNQQNLRLNPNDGTLTFNDGAIAYAAGDSNQGDDPDLLASAYTNSFAGTGSTTLYGIDFFNDVLVTQGTAGPPAVSPNTGQLFTVGSLGINALDGNVPQSFDIQPLPGGANAAFAALTIDGASSSLYSIDLGSGAATQLGGFGAGILVRALAIAPPTPLVGVDTANMLVRFNSNEPGTILSTTPISGTVGGEAIIGIDFRPATGQLYGLGAGSRLYTIDLASGLASQVGGAAAFARDPNSFGSGFDFNPVVDRIRYIDDFEFNLRINPNDGTLVDGDLITPGVQRDTNVDYAAGDPNDGQNQDPVGAAYTDDFAGATTTTLYGIDSDRDVLFRQGGLDVPPGMPSPNSGQLFTIGAGLGINLTFYPANGTNGFDIQTLSDGTDLALAALTTDGVSTDLYLINLTTGTASLLGDIGPAPALLRAFAIVPPSVTLSVAGGPLTEAGGTATVTAALSQASAGPVTVTLAYSGSATNGTDYTGPTSIVIPAGMLTASIALTSTGDALDEPDETIVVDVAGTSNATELVPQQVTVTITDDDLPFDAAPAVGLVGGNTLVFFNVSTPGTIDATLPISGLSGDTVLGIDFRPATGQLFAIGRGGSGSRLYTINLATGAATQVGSNGVFNLIGQSFGFDFNPQPDRIRIVSDFEQNFRLNPNDGTITLVDGDIAYAGTDVNAGDNPQDTAAAYTNSFVGAPSTVLYGIDSTNDVLVTQGTAGPPVVSPNSGQLFTVGPLGIDVPGANGIPSGFDILVQANGANVAFATLTTNGTSSGLYIIDLAAGTASLLGAIGAAPTLLGGFALIPPSVTLSLAGSPLAEQSGAATVTATLSRASSQPVTVNLAYSGTATNGADYTAPASIVIPAGMLAFSINITGLDDVLLEGNETIVVDVATVANGTEIGTQQVTATITDNDTLQPANIFAVSTTNTLVRFNSATPGTPVSTTPITGLQAGETILADDIRPATGQLFALGSTGRLYVIDVGTAVATQVGTGTFALSGTEFGFDFNPVPDRIRVVSNADQNIRLDPNTGAVAGTDTNLVYAAGDPNAAANPNVVAVAYTNNVNNATTTTLFGIDTGLDILVRQGGANVPPGTPSPNTGQLFTIGSLGLPGNVTDVLGFDIRTDPATGSTQAIASLVVGGTPGLYLINLATGAATFIGTTPGGATLRGLAIAAEGFGNTTLVGTTATFNGSAACETIAFDQAGGLLRHNRFSAGDPGFNSDFDFDPSTPGDQTLSASNAAVVIIVNAGTCDDTIIIGSASAPASGLAASFQVNGQGGGDTLIVNDTADATARAITIDGATSTITGLGGPITYGTLEQATVNAGSGGDTVTVQGTSAAATSINTLGGDDTVAFGNGATLSGGFVDGGTGTNTLDYSAYTSAVTVNLSTAQLQTLFQALVSGAQEPGPLSNSPASGYGVFTLNAAQTALTFTITVNGITAPTITGNHLHNAPAGVNGPIVRGFTPAEEIDIIPPDEFLAGVWSSTDPPGIGGVPTSGPLTPALVAELLANRIYFNTHSNLFPAGEARGQLIMQGTVSPATGTAGVRGFDNVTGGSAGDALTGNANVNVLRGGPGADTIVGGQGGDQLFGDAGNDLLVWNNGDGSDFMEGGADNDTVQVNGSPTGDDQFLIQVNPADPTRLRFDRTNLGLFNLNIGTTEALDFNTLGGDDTLTVEFAGGNPIPSGFGTTPGIDFDGGIGDLGTPMTDRLVLQRSAGAFTAATEVYNATGPGAGTITFNGASVIAFSNLTPVDDTVPVANFTFNAPAGSGTINVVNGPVVNVFNFTDPANPALVASFPTTQINDGGTGTFELINFANKTAATINSGTGGQTIVLNNPTAPAGLANLTINANAAADQVTITATPPGAATTVNTLGGNDLVGVGGAGVAAGTTDLLDGGPGFDTLNYDAGGATVTVTAGPLPGQTTITRPGSGTVVYQNFEAVTIFNAAPPPTIIVVPAPAITAVEGRPLVDVAVTQFTADPAATPDQYDVSINWGDGTLPSAGTVAKDLVNPALYIVTGSHTYDSPGVFTVTVTVREQGRTTTTFIAGIPVTIITNPAADVVAATAATVTAVDAPLDAQGATIAAIENLNTGAVTVATFLDTGGAESVGSYTVTIDWGDGTPTSTPVSVTPLGTSPAGTTFVVQGAHTYANPGVYAITTTIRSAAGSVGVALGQAAVTDGPLAASCTPFAATEDRALTNVTVATFTDAGGAEPIGSYSALIDWGDGSPTTLGIISFNPATQSFSVAGSHTYANAGNFTLSVQITSAAGSTVTVTCPVGVADVPIVLTGALDRNSDSGISNTDRITNDTTPTFFGTSEPGSLVRLFGVLPGQSAPTLLGQAVTDAGGIWQITSIPLPDGAIAFSVTATDAVGVTTATTSLGTVTIDTVGPQVTGVQLDRSGGRVVLGFRDDRAGLDGRSLIDGSNFAFTRANSRPGQFLVTGLSASPASGLTSTVIASINRGQRLRGGFYTLLVRSGGVQDAAGNALDGEFFGFFASGNGARGGDFLARLDSIHNVIFAPAPVGGTATPLVPPGTPGTSVLIPTVVEVSGRRLRQARAQEAALARQAAVQARRAARDLALSQVDVASIRRNRPGQ